MNKQLHSEDKVADQSGYQGLMSDDGTSQSNTGTLSVNVIADARRALLDFEKAAQMDDE